MIESIKKNKIGIMLMLCSSVFACVGQLLWKLSAQKGLLCLAVGFLFYGLGAVVMLLAYRHGNLSVLQPVLSMNYIVALLLSVLILGEVVTWQKIIGIVLITCSVVLIGGGDD